jgi:hypothetical protein
MIAVARSRSPKIVSLPREATAVQQKGRFSSAPLRRRTKLLREETRAERLSRSRSFPGRSSAEGRDWLEDYSGALTASSPIGAGEAGLPMLATHTVVTCSSCKS